MKKGTSGLVVASIVVASLSVGLGATPALAKPSAAGALSTSEASSARASSPASLGRADLTISADTPEPTKAPRRFPIGAVLNFIKSVGAVVWNACVKAAKSGWSKLVGWWNGLASWVRAGVKLVVNASATEILNQILDWIRHH